MFCALPPLAIVMIVLSGCASRDEPPASSADFGDVHGLAVHPDDPDVLFIATHHGLFRGEDGAFQRVGATGDDLMGFTAHPIDGNVFWSSGHPKDRTPTYTNLGVRKSTDGGRTWSDIALKGVDFHAMTTSGKDPQRLWGFWKGEVLRSDDGGTSWRSASPAPGNLYSLAGDFADANIVYAATREGLLRSTDAGASWSVWSATPALSVAAAPDGGLRFAAGKDGVLRSADGGKTWEAVGEPMPDVAFVAMSSKDPRVAYASSYQGTVRKTTDGGATWSVLRTAPS